MSTKAENILGSIQTLPASDQRELWQRLGQMIGVKAGNAASELYGEPMPDSDIDESARVTFQMLDQEEKSA
jgi:hypothetical protein